MQSKASEPCVLNEHERDLITTRSLAEFLTTEFKSRCARNPKYSSRAFARDLGLQASRISVVLKGKSAFSQLSIDRVLSHVNWPKPVANYFRCLALAALQDPNNTCNDFLLEAKTIRIKHGYTPVDADHRLVEQWELSTFALALLLRFQGEVRVDGMLAKRLGMTLERLEHIILDLEKVGWLVKTPRGHESSIRYFELGNQGSAYHIRTMHRRSLQQALWSLEHLASEKRMFYSTFFPMSPARYETLVEMVRTFVLAAAEDQNSEELGQEVYLLGSFLLPLTKS